MSSSKENSPPGRVMSDRSRPFCSEVLDCLGRSSSGALRIGLIGTSGAGKTSILRELFREMISRERAIRIRRSPSPGSERARRRAPDSGSSHSFRGLCYLPFGDAPGPVLTRVEELSRVDAPLVTFRDPDLFISLAPRVYQNGNTLLVVDEAQDIFPRYKTTAALRDILLKGRNKRIPLLWSTQRPTRCDTDLLGVTTGILVGMLLAPADAGYCREWGVEQPVKRYSFHVILPNHREIVESLP